MPRRNKREAHTPLDLTPESFAQPRINVRDLPRAETHYQRMDRERGQAEAQRQARIMGGIDWSVCLVPGCGYRLTVYNSRIRPADRDPEKLLPLCTNHAVAVWQQVQRDRRLPEIMETARERKARHVAEAAALAASRKAEVRQQDRVEKTGQIYFVQINELIKIGWTKCLGRRLKEYGAGAVLLCHYPASFNDETRLHRKLRPYLAMGREWYRDADAIRLLVDQAIEEHGEPTVEAIWSKPKSEITVRFRDDLAG